MTLCKVFLISFMVNGREDYKLYDMKNILFTMLLFLSSLSFAQEGFHLGVEVSPSWMLNTHRNTTTGLRSSESGYGFNAGVPIKYFFNEYMGIESGVSFEYMAFDVRVNNALQFSNRFGSVNFPLTILYQVSGNWYTHAGAGFKYQFMNKSWSGFSVDIGPSVNKIQPYVALGVSTLIERDKGLFELGAMARYHFINLWAAGSPQGAAGTSKVVSFDLMLKFFLFNS